MTKITPIFIRKTKPPMRKLTLQANSEIIENTRKRVPEINFSYMFEQICNHIDKNGLDRNAVLKLRLVRPEEKV